MGQGDDNVGLIVMPIFPAAKGTPDMPIALTAKERSAIRHTFIRLECRFPCRRRSLMRLRVTGCGLSFCWPERLKEAYYTP